MLKRVTEQAVTDPGRSHEAATAGLLPVTTHDLTFEGGGRKLIDGISLSLQAGPRTIVMGPNGAGKSLLLRLLHGLITPTSGEILWNGSKASEATRARQAFVFQRPVVLRRSTAANVEFVLRHMPRLERDARVSELLDFAGLTGIARTPARLLSGGEQQRLAIARAIATRPDVLFLDEPTASLDPASTLSVEAMIAAAHDDGVKIIMVTHDLGQARRLADEVVFVQSGKIAEKTPSREFFTQARSAAARDYLEGRIHL